MKPLDLTPIRFYVQDEHDGTYTLTLTLKNVTDRSWPAGKQYAADSQIPSS